MRRSLTAALAFSLLACGRGDDTPTTPTRLDPEVAARAFLADHVFDPPDVNAARFVREAEPGAFALKYMVKTPADYRFVDLWRVRTVDNRYVVEPLVELKGRPHVTTVWFELQDEAWKVAGWAPDATPVDPAEVAPSAGARVPIPFAPAAFRGAPPASEVRVEPPWNDIRILDREIPMEALPRVIDADDTCPRRRLERALDGLTRQLVECYGIAFEEGPYRRGRMAFDLVLQGEGPDLRATLAETTLIHPTLGDCVANVIRLAEVPPVRDGGLCKTRVAVTFSPTEPDDTKDEKKKPKKRGR